MSLRKPTTADSSAGRFVAVTPSDVAPIEECRALYVGQGGDLVLEDDAGAAVTFAGVAAGTVLPVRTRKVRATGTTAGGIVALL
ncbi:MAG: hypothetical protein KDG89_11705 [Geminicoccaceae bacterium]|nr:hypothetical protein [Geminicoccaceae bacterium]